MVNACQMAEAAIGQQAIPALDREIFDSPLPAPLARVSRKKSHGQSGTLKL